MRTFTLCVLIAATAPGCFLSGSSEDGSDTTATTDHTPSGDAHNSFRAPRTTVSADPSETLSTVDFGPMDQIQMTKPITITIHEQHDGSAAQELSYDLASSEEYEISLVLDYDDSTGSEHQGVLGGSTLGDLRLTRRSEGTTFRAVAGTYTVERSTRIVVRLSDVRLVSGVGEDAKSLGPVSGTVSGELKTECAYLAPADPDPYAPRAADAQVQASPSLVGDPDWSSEFCRRHAP